MDISAIPPVADNADGRTNTCQVSNHGFMIRVMAAIGPKQLDGGGLTGRVLVAFSISDTGALTAVRIAQSSGEDRLDRQALQIVSRASLPAPPSGLSVTQRSYVSAFTFS